MELSECIIATLETEGCTTVSEETLGAHSLLPRNASSTQIAIVVTDGSIEITFNDNVQILEPGNRLDIPADTPYSINSGKAGCNYVVGEF
jgi:quercetin dioxygenase-like cupin family protein